MVTVIPVERKSAVLTPSSLACLSRTPTVNLTAGCAHDCLYCYSRGFSNHPGEGRVALYTNALEKIRGELDRKRKPPRSVYFSPASDPFQPVPQLLDLAYDIMALLLERGIGVAVLTKGEIPPRHMSLLTEHSALVSAQVGLITLDEQLAAIFEPHAAPPLLRLKQAEALADAGIPVRVRLDPILPGLTDDAASLRKLLSHIARAGVSDVVAAFLYLRPAIAGSLRRRLPDAGICETLLSHYQGQPRTPIRATKSTVIALPREHRLQILRRVEQAAEAYEITVHGCACKNPDISSQACGIAGGQPPSEARQAGLF